MSPRKGSKTTPPFATPEDRWQAVQDRNRLANGVFVYAVKTTGIYCRPSCASRQPLKKNVIFFNTSSEASRAGYRPCRRCSPQQNREQKDLVTQACRYLETTNSFPGIEAIAEKLAVSDSQLRRLFKKETGLTMKAYFDACRARRLKDHLIKEGTVTQSMAREGYRSAGRFYSDTQQILGMSPTQFRTGGIGVTIRFGIGQSSLGSILVAMTDKGICSILLGNDPDLLIEDLQDRFPKADLIGGDAEFEQYLATVVAFVEDPYLGLDLPLDIRGTAFQQRVWQTLRKVPPGKRVTYTELARRISAPQSVRAVASACAANPIAVAIPCHRVVRLDGSLSGYRWGIERKEELLRRELPSH